MFLPPKMAASAGNLGPFVLVSRITNQISLVDPANMRTHTMDVSACLLQGLITLCLMGTCNKWSL